MKAALTSIAWKVLINFECIRTVVKYMYDSFILYIIYLSVLLYFDVEQLYS